MPFPVVNPSLARALAERGYAEPTPVQAAVLREDAAGRDLLVSAQTGSGKTVAYGLSIGHTLLGGEERLGWATSPLALIIAPTRELALQVERELEWLYAGTGARIVSCVGGMDARAERRKLAAGVHIVVGTPGRLRDHIERRGLDISALQAMVIDEADEMLDLGFREDLEFILDATPKGRRTLLFSATLPRAIVTLAQRYQNDALRIEVEATIGGHADIEYRVIRVVPYELERVVVNVLRLFEAPAALVFCNTRDAVRHLSAVLLERGFTTVALSGELSQSERNHAMQALRDGRARVCVATDVAARGIDLPGLGLVIHADLPLNAEVLQHRSGRTGRAGRKGVSVVLVPHSRRLKAQRMLGEAGVRPTFSGPPTVEEIQRLDDERLLNDPVFSAEPAEEDVAAANLLLAAHPAERLVAALVRSRRAGLPAPEEVTDPGDDRPRRRDDRPPAQADRPGRNERTRAREETREQHVPRRERGARRRDADAGARDAGDGIRPFGAEDVVHSTPEAAPSFVGQAEERKRSAPRGDFGSKVVFRVDVGRRKNADPKWLLPMICRRGGVTKREIGAIRIFENETHVEVAEHRAEAFARSVQETRGGGDNFTITPLGAGETTPAQAPRPEFKKRKPFDPDRKPHREGYAAPAGAESAPAPRPDDKKRKAYDPARKPYGEAPSAAPGHESRPPRDDYKKRKPYDPARNAGGGAASAPAGEGARATRADFKKRKPFAPAFKIAEGALRPRKKKSRKPA
ncbi:MAG: DEAD/DEAH box helicase [Bauldia sp.]|nr:DEAD/DEAH box helicase [Bauldia sp.]